MTRCFFARHRLIVRGSHKNIRIAYVIQSAYLRPARTAASRNHLDRRWQPGYNAGIYGTFIPASMASPQWAVARPLTNKQFPLSLDGTPGVNYAIQAATNLPAS